MIPCSTPRTGSQGRFSSARARPAHAFPLSPAAVPFPSPAAGPFPSPAALDRLCPAGRLAGARAGCRRTPRPIEISKRASGRVSRWARGRHVPEKVLPRSARLGLPWSPRTAARLHFMSAAAEPRRPARAEPRQPGRQAGPPHIRRHAAPRPAICWRDGHRQRAQQVN